MKAVWSEGRSGIGIPIAGFGIVGCVSSLPLHSWVLAIASSGIIALAGTLTSGFEVRGTLVRSFWGWGNLRFGRWQQKPDQVCWQIQRTRESLMNRRGAPKGVGIDSWDLGWYADAKWHSVHEFTDKHLAQEVINALGANQS